MCPATQPDGLSETGSPGPIRRTPRWRPGRSGPRRRRGGPAWAWASPSRIGQRRLVPAVGDPERPGVLGRAVAVADIAAERLQLEGAVGRVGVGPQVVAAPVDQELAQP